MEGAATLTFGGQDFTVRPLTIGQLRAVGVGAAKLRQTADDPVAAEGAWYDAMAEIISAALRRDHPEMTVEAVLALEADVPRLVEANRVILRLSGLVPAGEARAAAPNGASSTDS
ncbi:MAG TPA: hypothetical protein VN832_01385 [Stellaceae bacterium]|nr:hypothetical protein [Stellaceae bacterium]